MDIMDYVPKSDTVIVTLEVGDKVLKNEDGSDMTIEVYLPHSKEAKKVRYDQSDKLIEEKKARLKTAEAEELGLDFIAKTVKSWNITFGGEEPKLTIKKAKEVFEKAPWIVDLIEAKKAEQERFI